MPFLLAMILCAMLCYVPAQQIAFSQESAKQAPSPGAALPRKPRPGRTFSLRRGDGHLYVPEGYQATENVTITVHFHGAAWAAEQAFWEAKASGVLITVVEPGLSAAYSKPFGDDPKLFGSILDDALATLQANGLAPKEAKRISLRVSSFSAGYGAVRALLRQPEYVEQIGALILCDSLHTGYLGSAKDHHVNRSDLAPFARFAALAAEGKKTLLLTHTQIAPPDYASTTETADYLLQQIGAERKSPPPDEPQPEGVTILTRADKGNVHVWGCAGTGGPEHMRQLYALAFWFARLPAEGSKPPVPSH